MDIAQNQFQLRRQPEKLSASLRRTIGEHDDAMQTC